MSVNPTEPILQYTQYWGYVTKTLTDFPIIKPELHTLHKSEIKAVTMATRQTSTPLSEDQTSQTHRDEERFISIKWEIPGISHNFLRKSNCIFLLLFLPWGFLYY